MPNPSIYKDIVEVQVLIVLGAVPQFGFGTPLLVSEFPASVAFPGRTKFYTGSAQEILGAVLADGFSLSDPAYKMTAASLLPDPKLASLYIGRKDPLDATLTDAMNAIVAENDDGWYPFAFDTRSKADIIELATWAEQREFHWYMALTKDAEVLAQTPNNIVDLLNAQSFTRTAILFRDAASLATPAIALSASETFALDDGLELLIEVDGGAPQSFIFVATAASQTCANAEPFVLFNNAEFLISLDGGPTQTIKFVATAASVKTANAETYNIQPNQTLSVQVDGGAPQIATFVGTAGTRLSGAAEPFPLVDLQTLTISVNLAPAQLVTFVDNPIDFPGGIGNATANQVASYINANTTGLNATVSGGNVRLTSATFGTSSGMEITGGTANAVLNFPLGNNAGTGDAADLSAMTAAEAIVRLNADITGQTATVDGTRVKMTSATLGTSSQIQVTGGTANAAFAFSTAPFKGTGDAADITATTAFEVVQKFNLSIVGATSEVSGGNVKIISNTKGTASGVNPQGGNANLVLGFPLGNIAGTGDAANIKQTTAAEVATKINIGIVDAFAEVSGLKVKVTSNTVTTTSTLLFYGTANDILQFPEEIVKGTGTLEDYADCEWFGRCLVADLDQEQTNWNHQLLPTLVGDKLTPVQKAYLKSKSCNFIDPVDNRVRWGTMAKSKFYIDQRTTVDWVKARVTEALKVWLDQNADALKKIPYTQKGINAAFSIIAGAMERAENANHIDSRWRDNFIIPKRSQVSLADLNDRRLKGLEDLAFFVQGINSVKAKITLQVG